MSVCSFARKWFASLACILYFDISFLFSACRTCYCCNCIFVSAFSTSSFVISTSLAYPQWMYVCPVLFVSASFQHHLLYFSHPSPRVIDLGTTDWVDLRCHHTVFVSDWSSIKYLYLCFQYQLFTTLLLALVSCFVTVLYFACHKFSVN